MTDYAGDQPIPDDDYEALVVTIDFRIHQQALNKIERLEAENQTLTEILADINPALKCRSGCAVVKELDA